MTTQGAGSVHHVAFAVETRARQLEVREALLDTGWQVTPVIDRSFPLSELPEALRYYCEGHSRGKVLVTIV